MEDRPAKLPDKLTSANVAERIVNMASLVDLPIDAKVAAAKKMLNDALCGERFALHAARRDLDAACGRAKAKELVLVGWYLAHHKFGKCSEAALDYVSRRLEQPRHPVATCESLKKCLTGEIRSVANSVKASLDTPTTDSA